MQYRRVYQMGGGYFFTLITYHRQKFLTEEPYLTRLRQAFKEVMNRHPFSLEAIVILPDHLHCIWQMPADETDFSMRWMLIKRYFSMGLKNSQQQKFWQPRFWEHLIRDEEDWQKHMDYIYYNPVKHGYVNAPIHWKQSSFQRAVERGLYPENWGEQQPMTIKEMDLE